MSLIFIRHLPTSYNLQGLLQGQRDIDIAPLDDSLLQAIAQQREVLQGYAPFQQVLCSNLKRTAQTAVAYGYQAQVEPLLAELDFGVYEGRPRDEMLADVGEQWLHDPASLQLGEPVTDLLTRVQAFVNRYQTSFGNTLVFAHGSWMRAAQVWYQHASLQTMNQIHIANNALLILPAEISHA